MPPTRGVVALPLTVWWPSATFDMHAVSWSKPQMAILTNHGDPWSLGVYFQTLLEILFAANSRMSKVQFSSLRSHFLLIIVSSVVRCHALPVTVVDRLQGETSSLHSTLVHPRLGALDRSTSAWGICQVPIFREGKMRFENQGIWVPHF
jgi:hypothetical protein